MRIALPPTIAPDALTGLDPRSEIVDLAGIAMGTTWRIRLARPPRCDVEAIGRRVAVRLADLVAEMSQWEPASLLSRFNRAPGDTWHELPIDFATVVAAGLGVATASGGAFDFTIGEIVNLWGFGPARTSSPPSVEALEAALARSGPTRLTYDAPTRRARQPGGLSLDLSAIAKGYAADALAGLLRDAGVRHHLVEVGGELVGRGMRPDGDPWWVDLENPPAGQLATLRIALHGLAVATSGDYRRGNHTIDPRTGRPTANGVVSVSVIHAEAMVADAWATALTVMGADAGGAIATRLGLAARIITRVDGSLEELLTPALSAMLAG